MRSRPLLALPFAALALAGCGAGAGSGGSFSGEEQRVADAVEGLQEAAQDRDERRICRAVLAPAIAQGLGNCEQRINAVLDAADTVELTVEDVTITGNRARARVYAGTDEDAQRTIVLTRSGRDWRIADLGDRRRAPDAES